MLTDFQYKVVMRIEKIIEKLTEIEKELAGIAFQVSGSGEFFCECTIDMLQSSSVQDSIDFLVEAVNSIEHSEDYC